MTFQPYMIFEPQGRDARQTPLVVDSPHSGRIYPADFAYTCPLHLLKQTEDSYVDELVFGATLAGASLLMAEFPRSYIDVNRAEDDIDPTLLLEPWPKPLNPSERTLQGLGLIRRLCKSSVPVYGALLETKDVEERILHFYRPYHLALEKMISARVENFGECYLINAHSMPGQSYENRTARRPDFVLGDLCGKSSDTSFTRQVGDMLQEMGYSVALNDPYKGMEILKRYGRPMRGQHALQLEINRQLYMNEQTLEKHDGFDRLKADLTLFFQTLATNLLRDIPDRLAAE